MNYFVNTVKSTVKYFLDAILLALVPTYVRNRSFRKHAHLSWDTVTQSGIEPEFLIFDQLLPQGKTFIDVGANVGEYVWRIASKHSQQQVVAFEPIPHLASRLQRLFPQVTVVRMALSDAVGNATFKIPYIAGRPYFTRGTLQLGYQEEHETHHRDISVQLDTLDHFAQTHGLTNIGLIKIDVEGHEDVVIRGAQHTLQTQHPTLMIEIEQRHHANTDIRDFIASICALGYTCQTLDVQKRALVTFTPDMPLQQDLKHHKTSSYINNFIFTWRQ